MPPKARRRPRRPRPKPMRRPPSRRASRPRRPSRSRRSRRRRPSRSGPKPKRRACRHQGCRGCAGGQAGDAQSRRAERGCAAGRGDEIGADRTAPRRLPQSSEADGNWNTTSQRSLTLFNRYAKTKLDTKLASTDALDTHQAARRRGSARWSATMATRPTATAASRSPAPRARSSTTTMSARSAARRSRSPSATEQDRRNGGRRQARAGSGREAGAMVPKQVVVRGGSQSVGRCRVCGHKRPAAHRPANVQRGLQRLRRHHVGCVPVTTATQSVEGPRIARPLAPQSGAYAFRSRSLRCSPSAPAARC